VRVLEAWGYILTWQGVALLLAGMFLGTLAAVLPGLGATAIVAAFLPLTFTLDKYEAFIFLAAITGAGGFAGSVTAILLNVPGDSVNAATCLDGHPMARQGKAGVAIGASATASVLGSVFGMVVVVAGLHVLGGAILAFGPSEFFALSIAGVALIGTVSTRSPLKGIAAGLIGMMVGFVGQNAVVGGQRYTFGIVELYDGVSLVPILIGLFAIPEIFSLMTSKQSISGEPIAVHGMRSGVHEVLRRPGLVIRSCLLGSGIGLIPGVGQTLASWIAYGAAMKTSKSPETFGQGNIEGVIAPEATIDTKEAASMLPLFLFGLPSGVGTAIFLSVFQIYGVVPGKELVRHDLPLVWVIVLTIALVSVGTSLLGFVLADQMARLTLVPVALLVPTVYVLGVVSAFTDQGSLAGIAIALVFGAVGIVMERLDYPRAPLLIGVILVPFAEKNLFQARQLHYGSYEFLWSRPITVVILVVVLAALLRPLVRRTYRFASSRGRRPAAPLVAHGGQREHAKPAAQLSFAVALLGINLSLVPETLRLQPDARTFPLIVQSALVVATVALVADSARSLLTVRPPPEAEAAELIDDSLMRRSVLVPLLWLALLPALVWALGLVPASGIYTLLFALLFAPDELSKLRIGLAVIAAGALMALVSLVFDRWLHMPLYQGALR
jgi:putative tricarboxylic transport membrane protein